MLLRCALLLTLPLMLFAAPSEVLPETPLGARRNAIAYLGGTGRRGGDVAFEAVAHAFKHEKAAGLRRTAGDALCVGWSRI